MKEQFDLGVWLTLIVWPALAGLLGYQIKSRQQLADHKLHVAEHYVSKESMLQFEQRISRQLERIENAVVELNKARTEGR